MNAEVVLPLERMTVTEKFEVLQTVWDDLILHSDRIPAPDWHGQYLQEMKESVAAGNEKFFDLEIAEQIIRDQTP